MTQRIGLDFCLLATLLLLPAARMLAGPEPLNEHLRITEFLASNNEQQADANGNYSDWIEIWNPMSSAVDLEGYYLTDREGEAKWAFPPVTLASGEYLVVFASGADEVIEDEMHTNFRISRSGGGYLALLDKDGITVIDAFEDYPPQSPDISFGCDSANQLGYFTRPTPGTKNGRSIQGFVGDTRFSVDRGFYDEPFELEITTDTEGAVILYTLDGSEPKEGSVFTGDNGLRYTEPIRIDKTTTLRALAFKSGYKPTNTDTQTYLFIDDIARQPAQPEGWPEDWGTNGEVPGRVVADYEMDPRVVGNTIPGYGIREALLDIPTLSIVMNRDDFIGSDGIYTNPQSRGAAFEHPCSFELIYPNGKEGFQVDCGVEVHGNSSRRPWRMQKHSLRISFKSQYGPGRLRFPFFEDLPIDNFNKLVLRASFTDSWGLVSWAPNRYRPNDSQYIRDMWMKRSMRDMGHDALDGNFMHLYVNGLYWGLVNPAEKMEAETLVTHLGGKEEDYDVINDFGLPPIDGESEGWLAMHRLSRQDLDDPENYQALAESCDLVNFADYMLLHFFADAEDWPHHNGHAMRNRAANGPFKFYVWDQEIVLDNLPMRRYDSSDVNRPGGLFQELRQSKEFRLLFADRVQKHLFNDGALTIKPSQDRYMALANQIDKAIVAESARWGDTQMSTPYGNTIDQPRNPTDIDDLAYPPAPHGPDYYFTREDSWLVERDNVIHHYIPAIHDRSNSSALLNELEDERLWPNTLAPHFNQHGGQVPEGFQMQIIPSGGFRGSDTLYYTMDGSDPRAFGGSPSSSAQIYPVNSDGISLTDSVTVKARLQSKSNPFVLGGEWSPLVEATFRAGVYGSPGDLRVSEIMYHPAAASDSERAAGFESRSDFEFIELVNTGEGKINLEGLAFVDGITFHFPRGPAAELAPGAYALIVKNKEGMTARYGEGLPVIGSFEQDTQLANNGERLTLQDAAGNLIFSFKYDDSDGWPQESDGGGHALVPRSFTEELNLNKPESWTASANPGGSPGMPEDAGSPSPAEGYAAWRERNFPADLQGNESVAGPRADPDADGWANVFEYALDTDPLKVSPPAYEIDLLSEDGAYVVELRYPAAGKRDDVTLTPEMSTDLAQWDAEGFTISSRDGLTIIRRTITDSPGGYLRLRAHLIGPNNGE